MTAERKTIQIVDITDEQKTVKITARVVEPVELQGSLVEFQVERATYDEMCPPKMQVFEIWSEGYIATGERGGATFHGTADGITFRDACDNLAKRDPKFAEYYNPDALSYWCCKLHPTRREAQEATGY